MNRNVSSSHRPQARPSVRPASVERLEGRTLFATTFAHVTSVSTDNRAEVNITYSQALNPATVKPVTVQVYTAGPDNTFGTSDDVRVFGRVKTTVGNRRIFWRPYNVVPFIAGTPYSVKVRSQFVKDANGNAIDGEFNGPGVSEGNGLAGGDTYFLSKRDKSASPTARFSTIKGNIDVALDTVNTPKTYANFLHYADSGLWDFTFFHRNAINPDNSKFVVQGGGFNINPTTNTTGTIPTISPIGANEFHTSNTRGTIAMAKTGTGEATDQWFFNESDQNTFLDDPNNPNNTGGFVVFGKIKNAAGLAVMDAIGALPIKDYTSLASADTPQFGAMNETPVVNSASTPATLNPLGDLAIIRRVAILNKVVAYVPA